MLELGVGILGQQSNAVVTGDVVPLGRDVGFGPLIAWVEVLAEPLARECRGFELRRCQIEAVAHALEPVFKFE